MANRRPGMMNNNMNNRGFSNRFSQPQPNFQQGNVNPWQGGGGGGGNQGPQTQGLLNQLSNPQQLALALTSLLQQQSQSSPMNHGGPTSLLSLNTTPPFSNQDRDRQFGNRGRTDFRRHEPYNKGRNSNPGGGWRQVNDSPRGGNRNDRGGNNRRDGGNDRNRRRSSPPRRSDTKKDTPKKTEVKKDEPKVTADKVEKSEELIDLSITDETKEEETESKRDWKAEKKNTSSEAGKHDDGDDDAEDADAKEEGANPKDGKYYGVPAHFLHCFVCSKSMWDGESFQKHVRGRAHKQMLDSLEESFQITVNILRENMRLAEEKRHIELNRMQRLNRGRGNRMGDIESHCNMCDFKFLGKILSHRKTAGHQRLKRFLHPNCKCCKKEFPSRMEWVDHRLTPEHLRELTKSLENKDDKEGGAKLVAEEDQDLDLEPLMDETTELECENPILELDDDLSNLQNRVPAFRKNRGVGFKALQPFTGVMCTLCNRTFMSEAKAQTHAKSTLHYHKFVEAAKEKFQRQSEDKERKEKEDKVKDVKEDTDKDSGVKDDLDVSGDVTMKEVEDTYDPENPSDDKAEGQDEVEEVEDDKPEAETNGVANSTTTSTSKTEDVDISQLHTEVDLANEDSTNEPETASPGRPKRATNVRNGAGPKSKKPRK